ncbi:unnamed protein product [Lactuca virosa]|uniref:Uncharacterized protein n=1 Tax=Lactuca virosa TaxID=75947 RepID=A0AAU9N003_9ASTR|nr:unnamed protein product [Lactuca virosa]
MIWIQVCSSTVAGVSAGYGIMCTCEGSLYTWELSSGAKLGYLTHCRGATLSCLVADDSGSSGVFAVAVDGTQLQDQNIRDFTSNLMKHGCIIRELKQTLTITKAGMQFMQIKFHEEIQNLGLHIHGLASVASRCQIVLEENRKLYNEIQYLKGRILFNMMSLFK